MVPATALQASARRASGGQHHWHLSQLIKLVVESREDSLEHQPGRRHTQTSNMQLSLLTADDSQLSRS